MFTYMPPAPPQGYRFPPPAAAAPARPRQLVRAKAPDEPTPPRMAPILMPTPEQLGVAVRPSQAGSDGPAIQARIKELGIVSSHIDTMSDGRYRFTCWVPLSQPGLNRRIEAMAATQNEAVQLGLKQAKLVRQARP